MEDLTERQKSILWTLVPEYIERAVPIGSEFLALQYGFGVKPATIRNELVELTQKGYLEQPHTSAGRIPTDKGYRFYVDVLISDRKNGEKNTKRKHAFFDDMNDVKQVENFNPSLIKILNKFSDNLVWSIEEGSEDLIFEGFQKIFHQPEFQDVHKAERFFTTFDRIRTGVEDIVKYVERAKSNVFIGEEIELLPHEEYASIISSFSMQDGRAFWVSFFGPKRTRYKEHLELMDWLGEYFE